MNTMIGRQGQKKVEELPSDPQTIDDANAEDGSDSGLCDKSPREDKVEEG